MKISTFNKIEKYWWIVWKILTIILSVILIIFLLIQIKNNNVTFTLKGQKAVYHTITDKQECDLEISIGKFKEKHKLNEIYMFDWDLNKNKWNLKYKDYYEGQEVNIEKKFYTIPDMIKFLNSK